MKWNDETKQTWFLVNTVENTLNLLGVSAKSRSSEAAWHNS